MTAPLLALDLGNSRLKACALPSWEAAPSAVLEPGAELEPWLAQLQVRPELVALSSVADSDRTAALVARLESALGARVVLNPDCGLELELDTPETTGPDRLYAARAAVDLVGGPCVVVDAGTAMTVDAVSPGVFHGGAIAPGPALMARALSDGGALLPEFEPYPDPPALGRTTLAALEAGVGLGFLGAAILLTVSVSMEAGLPDNAPVVLTGGAAPYLDPGLQPGVNDPRPLRVDPWLVLRGVARAAQG